MNVYKHLEIQRTKLEQVQENTPRLAKASGIFITTGPGQFVSGDPFMFNVVFLEEPSFSSGSIVDSSNDLIPGDFPIANGMAYDWVTNTNGQYIGAHLYMVVQSVGSYIINHHFSFEGNAIKDFLSSSSVKPTDLSF